MPTHTINTGWSSGGLVISEAVEVTADGEINADIAVPGPSTDLVANLSLDVSEMKSLLIVSDQDVTIKTNSLGSPDDTLALQADEPVVWWSTGVFANPLTVDVTSLHIVNAGSTAATVKLRALQDVTP